MSRRLYSRWRPRRSGETAGAIAWRIGEHGRVSRRGAARDLSLSLRLDTMYALMYIIVYAYSGDTEGVPSRARDVLPARLKQGAKPRA